MLLADQRATVFARVAGGCRLTDLTETDRTHILEYNCEGVSYWGKEGVASRDNYIDATRCLWQ